MQLFENGEVSVRQELLSPGTHRPSRLEELVERLELTLSRPMPSARTRHKSRGILAAIQLYSDVLESEIALSPSQNSPHRARVFRSRVRRSA